jgi:hypothetical protein
MFACMLYLAVSMVPFIACVTRDPLLTIHVCVFVGIEVDLEAVIAMLSVFVQLQTLLTKLNPHVILKLYLFQNKRLKGTIQGVLTKLVKASFLNHDWLLNFLYLFSWQLIFFGLFFLCRLFYLNFCFNGDK